MKRGFDNDKYLKMQSEHILERIRQFDNKLYLEFGGKLFDDYHASRVLPGFQPDSKLHMLLELKDQAETIVYENNAEILKVNLEKIGDKITYRGQGTGNVEMRFVNCALKSAAGAKLEIDGTDSIVSITDAGQEVILEV